MATWDNVVKEIQLSENQHRAHNPIDEVRKKHLTDLSKHTNRITIAYYADWLSGKARNQNVSINDEDMNGFMLAVSSFKKEEREKGLDLILHTPGGVISATQAIMNYLLEMFNNDIRVFVPQIAMSAGTVMACCAKEIYMGKHSSLGPIDPQISSPSGFVPSKAVIAEFDDIAEKIQQDKQSIHYYQFILNKLTPSFLTQCRKAIEQSEKYTQEKLVAVMNLTQQKAKSVTRKLLDYETHGSHDRHINAQEARNYGLTIKALEDNQDLQDKVLTVHHCYMHTFNATPCYKVIENNKGKGIFKIIKNPNNTNA